MRPLRLLAPLGALLLTAQAPATDKPPAHPTSDVAGDLTATSAAYGPVAESVFASPPGFRKLVIAASAGAGKH